MIKLLYIFCVFLLVSCSTSKQPTALDEDLVFDENQSDLVQDLDFSDEENSENEEFDSFEEIDKKEAKKDVLAEEASAGETIDFEDFSDDDAPASAATNTSNDFDLFDTDDDAIETPEVTPPLISNEDSFDSPLDTDDLKEDTTELGFDFDDDENSVEITSNSNSGEDSKVLSIDYNAVQNGGSFVVKTSNSPSYDTEYIPETNQYVLRLKNAKIGKSLARPFLTKDFQQSFEALNSYQGDSGDVKLVFQLKPNSYPVVSKVGDRILIEPGLRASSETKFNNIGTKPGSDVSLSATSFEDFLLGNSKFVGQPISLQVKDESVVTVIQFISEQVGANIILSEEVKGNVSIKLKDVPWDQALVAVMKVKGLGYVRSGNILRISTLADLQKESESAAQVKQARKTLAPFHVKVFPLSYAKPDVLEGKVKPFLTTGTGDRAGQVISEVRSSSLIVRDTLAVIQNVAALIKELDRPPLQVMIQAKIVEATKSFSKNIQAMLMSGINTAQRGGQSQVTTFFDWASPRNGNTESEMAFIPKIEIGGIDFLGTLTAQLRLQEIESKAKILSSPSVLVVNNETASISQSDEVLNTRSVITTGQRTTEVVRNPVELKLEVTPQVSADSNITMAVDVKRQFPVGQGNLGAAINTREAKTKVIIGNNRTAMIAGIYQVTERKTLSGTPVLRKIPILKWMFQGTDYQTNDSELIIFITPRVVNQKALGKLANKKLTPSAGDSFSKFEN